MNQDHDFAGGNPASSNCRVSLTGGQLPPMISYAQNFEDVIIRRALQEISGGFYVDLGAYDSEVDSVTRWFYQNGWRGVNVEPFPALHAKLQLDRPEDTNLWCAIGAEAGTRPFYVIAETGLSTLVEEQADLAEAAGYPTSSSPTVPVQTLDEILERYGAERVIDFLKIDVEGSEAEILNATSFSTYRPRLLIIEAVWPFTREPAWADWEPSLLRQGYQFAWFDGLNRFYIRQEDGWRSQLFGIPPSLFDNFKLSAHAHALSQLSAQTTQNGDLREELTRLSAASPACDTLREQVDAMAADQVLRERAPADVSARADLLSAQNQDLSAKLEDLEGTLAAMVSARDALHGEVTSLAAVSQKQDDVIAEWSARSNTLEAQVTSLVTRLQECEGSLVAKCMECDALSAGTQLLRSRIGAQEQALQAKESEILQLSMRLAAEQREARVLADNLLRVETLLAEAKDAHSVVSERLRLQNQRLAALTASAESAATEMRNRLLEIADLRKQQNALLASLSWRITAPVRRAAKLLLPGR